MHFGIDYGSKLAGTTVITYEADGALHQIVAAKKQDADKLILVTAERLQPSAIYLDAPLSLPAAYHGTGTDYHYRQADRELGAMSPMFLGGLTARAMKLKSEINSLKIPTYETYPGAYIRAHEVLKTRYSKKDVTCIDACLTVLQQEPPYPVAGPIVTLHQLDSTIAWLSGWRHIKGLATAVGDIDEGIIYY